MLRRDGYAARIRRQVTARKLRLQQQGLGIDPTPVQVAQGLTGGGAAAPQKRALRKVALGNAPHGRTLSMLLSNIWPDLSRLAEGAVPIKRWPARDSFCRAAPVRRPTK